MSMPSNEIPDELKDFINSSKWTFASTMADIPHWYIVKKFYNKIMFEKLVVFIRNHGVVRRWFNRVGMYLDYDGHSYWTMGNPISETTIINRKVIVPEDKKNELPRDTLDESKLPDVEVQIKFPKEPPAKIVKGQYSVIEKQTKLP